MKIVLDRDLQLTRGDYGGNPKRDIDADIRLDDINQNVAKITHAPIDLFYKYGKNSDFSVYTKIEKAGDIGTAYKQYSDLREGLLLDNESQKSVDQKFLIALRHGYANFDRLFLQKVTYQLDADEDIEKIGKLLENMETNALFRALAIDKDNNIITTYASREGIWNIDGVLTAKSAELRSAGSIRTDRAVRSVREPTKKVDAKRINYPLFEETKALMSNNAIKYSYATREQPDGEYKDDTHTVYVTPLHFKEDLTEEDTKTIEAVRTAEKNIKEETTHVGKGQATKEEAQESLEQNKKEIHTKHEVKVEVKEDEEIKEEKDDAMKLYVDRLFNDLETRQKAEKEELQQKIKSALGEQRQKAKQTFVTSLSNGMTVTEAIANLKSAKNNDIMIELVLEDVKNDMILSVQKDQIIAETKKDLASTTKDLDHRTKKLETVEKANKTNHDNYTLELNKRKEAEIAIGKLKSVTDKMKDIIDESKANILDLKEIVIEKDKELVEREQELDIQFNELEAVKLQNTEFGVSLKAKDNQITSLKDELSKNDVEIAKINATLETIKEYSAKADETIKAKDQEIAGLKDELSKNDIAIAKINATLETVKEYNAKADETIKAKDQDILDLSKRLTSIENMLERSELLDKEHKEVIKQFEEENSKLKEDVLSQKEAKKEPKEKSKLSQEIQDLKNKNKDSRESSDDKEGDTPNLKNEIFHKIFYRDSE